MHAEKLRMWERWIEVSLVYLIIYGLFNTIVGSGSVVSIATAYGLDGPRIESWLGQDFPRLSRPALGPAHPPVQWYSGSQVFPGGKVQLGHDADPSPRSSAEVKNRVELYLYSP